MQGTVADRALHHPYSALKLIMTKKPKIHYAWMICIAGSLMMLCSMGLCSNIFAVYLPFIEEAGLSGAQGSAIVSVRCISSFVCSFLVTAYYDRISLRLGSAAAVLAGALSSVLFSVGGSPTMYYAASAVAGISYGFGTVIPASLLMNNWFLERRALAMGIASAGSGLASILFAPLITSGVLRFGLRTVYLLQGVLIALCAVAVFLIVRDRPEDMNLTPYGDASDNSTTVAEPEQAQEHFAIPGGIWILLSVMMLMAGGSGQAASSHLSILTVASGYSAQTAALVATLFGLFLIVGKFIYGEIADRSTVEKASVLFMLIYAAACCESLLFNGTSLWCCWLFPLLLGLGCSFFTVGYPLWAADLSSAEHYSKTLRRFQILYCAGGIIFTGIPGRIADSTGEYKSSYLLMALLVLVSLFMLHHAYRRRAQRYE